MLFKMAVAYLYLVVDASDGFTVAPIVDTKGSKPKESKLALRAELFRALSSYNALYGAAEVLRIRELCIPYFLYLNYVLY